MEMNTCLLCLCLVDRYAVCGVSLNRKSYQSSVYSSGDGFRHKANLANDGYHDLTICAITNTGTNPWWEVDLGVTLKVINVTITSGVPDLSTGKKVRTSRCLQLELYTGQPTQVLEFLNHPLLSRIRVM